ncbi:MAG TPA: GMC family oxidoreductase [Roseiflexaceae bacterium]|nr:GMC family oxidoreductase [Roseiflexaceae bacterium]
MAVHRKVDVVTIGAGWTAGIIAQQLTQKGVGLRVVSIEQGPARWATPDFEHNHDSLRYSVRRAMMVNLASQTWTWRPNPRAPSLPMRQYGSFHPGQGIGGAGTHWAAQHWRFYPADFRYRSHHLERYGQAKLPPGALIQDWPLTYAELEPYYDRVDYDIGVSGQAGNLRGQIQPGGDPFEGPRARPYPLPPLARSKAALLFERAATQLGYHPFPQPAAILSQAYADISGRTRSGCLYCGFCTRFGCEVDAKASANVSHIPLALRTGNYEIRTNCKVLGITLADNGLATGVTYVDQVTGEQHTQPADIVIVSAYALENVRLLLLSRGPAHPNGIGNDRGMVGQRYTYQLVKGPVAGIFEGQRFNTYMGNSCLQNVVHDLNADNFDHADLDFIGGASITCGGGENAPLLSTLDMPELTAGTPQAGGGEERPHQFPPIPGELGSLAGKGKEWGQAWKENLRHNWDGIVGIGIQGESLPYEDQFLDLDPLYKDNYGLPLLRITYDFHDNDTKLYRYIAQRCKEIMEAMGPTRIDFTEELKPYTIHAYQSTHATGGAIMGADPGSSVTNKYGQVWDTPNVFVTGAALYPQNPGMNPTGTLLALAYLTADGIRSIYLKRPAQIMV